MPIYETAEDISKEEAASHKFISCLKEHVYDVTGVTPHFQMKETPNLHSCDRLVFMSVPIGFRLAGTLEIKVRTCTSDAYDTYMISLNKIVSNVQLADSLGVKFYLCVQWTDAIGFIEMTKETLRNVSTDMYGSDDFRPAGMYLHEGGRVDRGNPRDIEMMMHININHFRIWKNEELTNGED